MFLYYLILKNQTKLIKENFITPYRADPLARVDMEHFHLACKGSRQNQAISHLGGLAHFPYEHIIFL